MIIPAQNEAQMARWNMQQIMLPSEIAATFGEQPKPCPFCGCLMIGLCTTLSPYLTCASCGAVGPAVSELHEPAIEQQRKALTGWQGAACRQPVLPPEAILNVIRRGTT
jgi:hypothetical protein